ncbi:uncharacterized protein [Haliotis asinina]|uniref:uncharacterized protein n=1 Tax=Haliotis asinina TaxID=109174 RepID=UPI003532194E
MSGGCLREGILVAHQGYLVAVEDGIADQIKAAALTGFGITRRQLVLKVARICRRLKLTTPFKNDVPGKGWIAGFMKRHPDIHLRSPVPLTTIRARMLNPCVTNSYFEELEELVQSLKLNDKPHLIWNIDETSVPLTHKPTKVLAEAGVKNVPGRVGNIRDNVTVLACINAAGGNIPPMAIVKGKTPKCLQAYNTPAGVPGTAYTYQSRAWMEDTLGEGWFEAHFLKHCGPERPQLIVLDSHSSHETLGLLEKAKANDVTILAFPPHTTQWLCPLDKSVFGPLSREWNRVCSEFMVQSPNNLVTKWEWPRLFKQAYDIAFTPSNVCSGFRKCGIFPVNTNSIPDKAFAPSKPFDVSFESSGEEGVADIPVVAEADTPVNSGTITPDAGASATPIAGVSVDSSTSEAALPEGASLLSDTDFILSVLAGDTPSSLDESGNLVIEIATVSEAEAMDAIKSEFSLPPSVMKQSSKSNPRKLTSHRILTSDEIIKMKTEKRDEKEKLEREKQARMEARQSRQKGYLDFGDT